MTKVGHGLWKNCSGPPKKHFKMKTLFLDFQLGELKLFRSLYEDSEQKIL